MATWLKLIGSARSPITEWQQEYVGFRKASKPSIRTGNHLFFFAPGGSRRVFALAEAVSEPEHDSDFNPSKEESRRWKLRVRYGINFPVTSGVPIDDVSSHRDLTNSLRQASHIKLFPEDSESANSKLRDAKQ
jgi:hypothetical protein